jgi:hypothetical protein
MIDTSDDTTTSTPAIEDIDSYVLRLLAKHRKIAAIWSIEDAKAIRPDSTDDQAWELLQQVESSHDVENGITWTTLEASADDLFGPSSETDEDEEAGV